MSCATRSLRASIASAAFVRYAARDGAGSRDQPGNAAAPAATASRASSGSEAWNAPVTSDGRQGLRFSYVAPDAVVRQVPPM